MDIRNFYIEKGTGSPLILLHGNGEDSLYFRHQIEEFAKDFHVYALDTRGHGKTPRGSAPFTIRQFAGDLKAFMDDHNIQKADILGFSDGANIAMCFALKYPQSVGRLILNGGNLDPSGLKPLVQIPVELEYGWYRLFSKFSSKARARAEMLGLMVNDPAICEQDLKQIQAPALVIAGSEDMIKTSHSRKIADWLGNAQFAEIPGTHFIASENPELFNQAVRQFLKDTPL